MTENIIHWSDEAQLLGYGESDSTGAWLKFRITPEDLDRFRGLKGTVFYLTTVEIANDGQPVAKTATEIAMRHGPTIREALMDEKSRRAQRMLDKVATVKVKEVKPFGAQASELYRTGFFYAPAVLEAIGTDAEFLGWIRAQPCAVTGVRDYHTDEATGITTERCDPAHVRTVANGAGTGIKPPYCAIPLVHEMHVLETIHGKSALYVYAHPDKKHNEHPEETARLASEWMDGLRNKYVVEWASTTLAWKLGAASMGFVQPTELRLWAIDHGVEYFLPAAYK